MYFCYSLYVVNILQFISYSKRKITTDSARLSPIVLIFQHMNSYIEVLKMDLMKFVIDINPSDKNTRSQSIGMTPLLNLNFEKKKKQF